MLSRARVFAAVTFMAGCLATSAAWAQVQNLEAGKSASQLFAGTCTACHKSPRGLMKTVSPGSLPGFLREHYTTSGDMAAQLSSFLISNGANDPRQAKQGSDKPAPGGNDQAADRQGRKSRNAPAQEAVRPDDGAVDGARPSRRRQARPEEAPEEAARAPAQAAVERAPDGRRLKRPGRAPQPGSEEPSALNEPARMEPSKADSAKETGADDKAKAEIPKGDTSTAERAKPNTDVKPNEARIEAPKDMGASDKPPARRDPGPAVVPPSVATAPAAAASSGGLPEPAAPQPKAPPASEPAAVTASAPFSPPAQAGPPMPPISR